MARVREMAKHGERQAACLEVYLVGFRRLSGRESAHLASAVGAGGFGVGLIASGVMRVDARDDVD